MGISTLVALSGIGLAFVFFGGGYRAPAHAFANKVPGLVALARDKFRIDELYGVLIIRPLRVSCDVIFKVVDRFLIDRVLIGGWAFLADMLGRVLRFFQAGDVQRYAAAFAIGVAALVWVAARPACPEDIRVSVDGNSVRVDLVGAEKGTDALQYGFDFDGDGNPDRQGATPSASWIFSGPDRYTVTITISDPRWHTQRTLKRDIEIR
jgi:hypothetical protein